MPAHPQLIGYLQRAVSHEFGAAQQFTLQAVQAECLGLDALAAELRAGAIDELRHAEVFVRRLHELAANPRSVSPGLHPVGRNHAELLQFGMATEAEAIRLYAEAARCCERIADRDNRELFARIMRDEEQHHRDLVQRWQQLGGDVNGVKRRS